MAVVVTLLHGHVSLTCCHAQTIAYTQDHLLLTTLSEGYILEVGVGPTFINGKKHTYELEDREGDIAYYNLYFYGKGMR